jgi:hypothetical protein
MVNERDGELIDSIPSFIFISHSHTHTLSLHLLWNISSLTRSW